MKTFSKLFEGRHDAYGQYVTGKKVRGKLQGKAWTESKLVTKDLYREHLNGKVGLGIVPLMEDGFCLFGAIDIDDYSLDLNKLESKLKDLPLILCRTKSGGAHLYLFAKEPISAIIFREKLFEFSLALGHSSTEIFPKQIEGF